MHGCVPWGHGLAGEHGQCWLVVGLDGPRGFSSLPRPARNELPKTMEPKFAGK